MIRLVRAGLRLLDAALEGRRRAGGSAGSYVVRVGSTFTEPALAAHRAALAAAGDDARWGIRLFVTDDRLEPRGLGRLQGPPIDGVVELGYEIAEARAGAVCDGGHIRRRRRGLRGRDGDSGSSPHAPRAERLEPSPREGGLRFDGEAAEGGERSGASAWRAHRGFRPGGARRRGSALELTVAGEAAAGGSGRQPAPRGKSGHRRAGWSGDVPAKAAGKCHRNEPPQCRAAREPGAGKGEKVR